MARARLRDRHQENLRKKLEVLIAEQGVARSESEAEASEATSEKAASKTDEAGPSTAREKAEDSDSKCVKNIHIFFVLSFNRRIIV